MEIPIIYEDDFLLVINKPAGYAAQPDEKGQPCVLDFLSADIPWQVVHRLDLRVSGLMLLAKNPAVAARLSESLRQRKTQKYYRAVTGKKPEPAENTLTHWLIKDARTKKAKVANKKHPTAKQADLAYRLLQASERYFLLEIQLFTGRFHQIRVQLAAIGCPIVGDLKYGYPRSSPDGSIFLQAYRLEFPHPVTHEIMAFELPMPELWHKYGF